MSMRQVCYGLCAVAGLLCMPPSGVAQVGMREIRTSGLQMMLVYPTKERSQKFNLGSFVLEAARGAQPQRGNGRLVVLSHGTAGSAIPDFSLAAAFVRQGFIVAQPLHAKDNYLDASHAGPQAWRTRPAEISASIDYLKNDAQFGALFDSAKVGVHGMSAGGHTALVMAGGQWRLLGLLRHCAVHVQTDVGFCLNGAVNKPEEQAQRRRRFTLARYVPELFLPRTLTQHEGGNLDRKIGSQPDQRVRSVTLAVPVVVSFSEESLATLPVPVGVVSAEDDEVLVPSFHSSYLLRVCKTCKSLTQLPKAGHFNVLDPWPAEVAQQVAKTQMRGGVPRPDFVQSNRALAHQQIVQFHAQHLLP